MESSPPFLFLSKCAQLTTHKLPSMMKQLILCTVFLVFISMNTYAQCEQLIWQDNFDGSNLNLSNWDYEYGDGCPELCGWGNAELQHYTDQPENITVSNGTLKITAHKNTGTFPEYTSSRIRTKGLATFQSGRIEARIKMPIGQGLWPAFWMLPEDFNYGSWPLSGEIDITEMLGQEPSISHGTIHYGAKWPMNQYQGNSIDLGGAALHDDFHTYAIEWEQDEIRWYLDNQLFSTKTKDNLGSFPWRFDQDFHLLLNVAIGGNWPGYPNASTPFPQSMEVDYVRVYENVEQAIISGPKSAPLGLETTFEVSNLSGTSFEWSVENGTIISEQGNRCTVVFNQSGNQEVLVTLNNGLCASSHNYNVHVGDECAVSFSNFDNRFGAHWSFFTGGYNDVLNPTPNEINPSSTVARWNLQGNQNDRICFALSPLQYSNSLVSGNLILGVKVNSNAPQGTVLELILQNENEVGSSFNGNFHSKYLGACGASNEWSWVYFSLSDVNPQEASTIINQMTLRPLSPPSFPYTIHFDDFSLLSEECTPTQAALSATLEVCDGSAPSSVRMTGPWWQWNPNGGPIAENNGDGTWTVTFDPPPAQNMEYLWVVDGVQENLINEMINGGDCAPITDYANYANRLWSPGDGQISDFFERCGSCETQGCTNLQAVNYDSNAAEDDGSCLFNLSLQIDMSSYPNSFNQVYLSGTFNDWSANASPLNDNNNDGIWEITIPLPNGNHEYKFQTDEWTDSESFQGGELCTNTTGEFINRIINLNGSPVELPLVCWESCSSCAPIEITFSVDMSNESISPNGVYLAGDFQNWNPSSTPMNPVGFGIYSSTVLVQGSGTIYYRFLNGSDLSESETVLIFCGSIDENGILSRSIEIPSSNTSLATVCFSECSACSGCTDPMAINFNPYAIEDDGTCLQQITFGCIYEAAINYNPNAQMDDGSCLFETNSTCPSDLNEDGLTNSGDLLLFLGEFGSPCEAPFNE